MPKKPKLVKQDADGFWFAPPLAAEKSGLTKPELARRALAGTLLYHADDNGKPAWYAESQIMELAKARLEAERAKPAKTKRIISDAALEARHTKEWKEQAKTRRYGSGPLGDHLERIMLLEIEINNKKRRDFGEL